MDRDVQSIAAQVQDASAFVYRLREEIGKVIVGQRYLVDRLLIGLLANGHVLLEGVPGLAKTLSVKTLAQAIDASFQRIQFTPDLLPADLIGTLIYNPREGVFTTKKGPDLRQPHPRRRDQPRPGQGAERAARGDAGAPGHDRRRDASRCRRRSWCSRRRTRSSRRAPIRCPRRRSTASCSSCRSATRRREEERQILDRMATDRRRSRASSPVTSVADILRMRGLVDGVYLDDKVKEYIVDLVFATREPQTFKLDLGAVHPVRRLAARDDLPDARRQGARLPRRAAATSRRRT